MRSPGGRRNHTSHCQTERVPRALRLRLTPRQRVTNHSQARGIKKESVRQVQWRKCYDLCYRERIAVFVELFVYYHFGHYHNIIDCFTLHFKIRLASDDMCKTKHSPYNQSSLECFQCLKTFCNVARFWSFPWRNDLLKQLRSAVGECPLKETSIALIRVRVWGGEDRKHSICSIRTLQRLEWELWRSHVYSLNQYILQKQNHVDSTRIMNIIIYLKDWIFVSLQLTQKLQIAAIIQQNKAFLRKLTVAFPCKTRNINYIF